MKTSVLPPWFHWGLSQVISWVMMFYVFGVENVLLQGLIATGVGLCAGWLLIKLLVGPREREG